MSSLTDKYTTQWCRENPGRASALIQHYEGEWANCSQHCARIQTERDALAAHVERIKAKNRMDVLIEIISDIVPAINEGDFEKDELLNRLHDLRNQAEGGNHE